MLPIVLLNGVKFLASVHLGALAMQPVLAGQYFEGSAEAIAIHSTVGETIAWLALLQAMLAVVCWRRNILKLRGVVLVIAIFLLDGLQLHLGFAKTLAIHIPLGAWILAISLATTIWLWSKSLPPIHADAP